ncbi:cytoskeletal protein RodZ [Psychrobacillus insolitus]|uniref:Cytoskeletal protein RodZ n=1 Tax=Psychrobacillus insolitus TaxID=1461 RepID=A0A2W7MKF3_9BACI|nr:RodZ domain-containing protein [Psychrobacillus insolitus]PZX07802.1 cytoskeletal protein RodZ [Psychrobacillus insolitus]
MTELGARLKEARTEKGYSIDDLQEITKIQKRYLAGIEEGNYASMPGAFYVRAFIKQYAEAVGLNGDELLETYKKEIPSPANEDVSQNIPSTPTRRSLGGRSSNKFLEIFPMLVVALIIIAIIIIAWTLFQNLPKNSTDPEVTTEKVVTVEEQPNAEKNNNIQIDEPKEEKVVKEVVEPIVEQKLTFVETEGQTSTYHLTGAENFMLKIVATNNTWLNIKDENNQILTDKAVNAGETFELDTSDSTRIRVRLGSTPGNQVFMNDQLVEYPTDMVTQNLVIQFNK